MRQVVLFLRGKFITPKLAVSSVTAPTRGVVMLEYITIWRDGIYTHNMWCFNPWSAVLKHAPGGTTWGHDHCRCTCLGHLVGKSLAYPSGLIWYVLISIEFDQKFIIFVVLSIVQTKIFNWVSDLVHAQPIIRINLCIHQ